MITLAFASFLILVVAWLVAPSSGVAVIQLDTEDRASERVAA